jgi:hypothetical protein
MAGSISVTPGYDWALFTWQELGGFVGEPNLGQEPLNMLATEQMPKIN